MLLCFDEASNDSRQRQRSRSQETGRYNVCELTASPKSRSEGNPHQSINVKTTAGMNALYGGWANSFWKLTFFVRNDAAKARHQRIAIVRSMKTRTRRRRVRLNLPGTGARRMGGSKGVRWTKKLATVRVAAVAVSRDQNGFEL